MFVCFLSILSFLFQPAIEKTMVQIHGTAVPHVERVGARNTFFCYFATQDVSATVAHLQCSGKRSWIKRNKLPVDVVGADVNHSQSNQVLPSRLKATSAGSFRINVGLNWLPHKNLQQKGVDMELQSCKWQIQETGKGAARTYINLTWNSFDLNPTQ